MDYYQQKLHALFLEHVAQGTTQEDIDAFLDESVDINYKQGAALNIAIHNGNKQMVDILVNSGADTSWVSYNPYEKTYEASYDKILPIIYSLTYDKTPKLAHHWVCMSMTDINTYEIALQSKVEKNINFLLGYLSKQPLCYWELTEKYIDLPIQKSLSCLARSNNNEVLEWFAQKKSPIDDVFNLYKSVMETVELTTYQQLEKHYPIDLHNNEKSNEIFLWTLQYNQTSGIIDYWKQQHIEFFAVAEASSLQNYVLENIAQSLLTAEKYQEAYRKIDTLLDYVYSIEPHNIHIIKNNIKELKTDEQNVLNNCIMYYELHRDLPLSTTSKHKVKI